MASCLLQGNKIGSIQEMWNSAFWREECSHCFVFSPQISGWILSLAQACFCLRSELRSAAGGGLVGNRTGKAPCKSHLTDVLLLMDSLEGVLLTFLLSICNCIWMESVVRSSEACWDSKHQAACCWSPLACWVSGWSSWAAQQAPCFCCWGLWKTNWC